VFLLKKLGIKFNKQEYVAWIKKCQGFEGGFGLGPGSTSFLESTHAALTALSILRSSPNDIEECEKFIRCCQAGRGGFGRQITTVPTLESTYQVVHSFKLVSKMRRT
jgi:prenyltransferase beta subunit